MYAASEQNITEQILWNVDFSPDANFLHGGRKLMIYLLMEIIYFQNVQIISGMRLIINWNLKAFQNYFE